ncbi:MAG: hypothetical protein H0X29_03850 [Parachlamydiaceae bacterium]|nr:hypothetical protein [Parachlamydiaceae bacterium]
MQKYFIKMTSVFLLCISTLMLAHDNLPESYLTLDSLNDLSTYYEDFENDPHITQKEKDSVRPYLLPTHDPIKIILDSIFLHTRPLHNAETFAEAGFFSKFIQPRSFIRVASHYQIPGYLFKVYLDSEIRVKRNTPGWVWFTRRAKNSRVIGEFIKSKKIKNFIVPKKWIYPTPLNDRSEIPLNDMYTIKNEILVVEDMELVSKEENKLAWKTKITARHLDEFLAIIQHAGGSSYRADNVAYTKSGKFAFIDTEYITKNPNLKSIIPYLSPKMVVYWKKIIKKKKRDSEKKY